MRGRDAGVCHHDGEVVGDEAVAGELAVDAHEREAEGAPARVGGVDERAVVPPLLKREG